MEIQRNKGVFQMKFIFTTICVLYAFYLGFTSVGEQSVKTATEIYYNWAAVPKRIVVSVAISVPLGIVGYALGLCFEKLKSHLKSY